VTRFSEENLISMVIVASGDLVLDESSVRAMSKYAAERFTYYEILLVAAGPSSKWRERMSGILGAFENTRLVMINRAISYEELNATALRYVIGDYVIGLSPGEIGDLEIDRLVNALETGRHDLVKMFFSPSVVPWGQKLTARILRTVILLSTGQRVQAFRARAFGLSRSAISKLQIVGGTSKFFHFLDLSNVIAEAHLTINTPPPRRLLRRFSEKVRMAADLVSLSSERLVRSVALTCFILSMCSAAAVVGAFLIWLLKEDVAPGWTSLTMVFSALFAANFGVFSALCLGLLQVLRQGAPDTIATLTSELSSGEFFRNDDRINVENVTGHVSARPPS
jgi:hypothetical protein